MLVLGRKCENVRQCGPSGGIRSQNDVSDPGLFFTLLSIHHETSNSLLICPPTMAFCLTTGSIQVFCFDLTPLE